MNLFLDTEFTGLHQQADLISLALVSNDRTYFYAEFTDFDAKQLTDWHKENVLPYLILEQQQQSSLPPNGTFCLGDRNTVKEQLIKWLEQWDAIEVWADVSAYDWVFFCELFGGALHIPKQIHFIVRDLATFFQIKGVDTNIDRFAFAYGESHSSPVLLPQHNALSDAWAGLECYRRLISST